MYKKPVQEARKCRYRIWTRKEEIPEKRKWRL